ncbi:MAG TPA: ABC transporter [Lachnoclostridium sp.]|nr:ABC transporter [Lachnoclostridium sp.]
MSVIEIRGLSKKFGKNVVLDNIDLVIHEGDVVAIIGPSGTGKSTLLRSINLLEKPEKGTIKINDQEIDLTTKSAREKLELRKNTEMVFQQFNLFKNRTALENVMEGLMVVKKLKKSEARSIAEKHLQKVGMGDRLSHYPRHLSGGQQQRVALARMLLYKPDIIMLDEPFSALDGFLKDTLQMEMLELIRDYSGDVLMVSHSRDEIYKFCDHMMLLLEGKTILKGCTNDIFRRPERMEAAKLTGCKNISSIEKISDYELYACEWKIRLITEEKIGDSIKYVGIRGHNLIPVQKRSEENVMGIELAGFADTPFQRQYLFQNSDDKTSSKIWWIQDKMDFEEGKLQNIPPFIKFPKEDLLLLL